jgi:hypothetical protein
MPKPKPKVVATGRKSNWRWKRVRNPRSIWDVRAAIAEMDEAVAMRLAKGKTRARGLKS